MRRLHCVAKMVLFFIGLLFFSQVTAGYAEEFTMQLPAYPKITYRITSDNQVIRPERFQISFARNDSSPFCNKVIEVGVYSCTMDNNFAYIPAPGPVQAECNRFTSPIFNGAVLCSFNTSSNLVSLHLSGYGMEQSVNEKIGERTDIMKPNFYLSRREKRQYDLGKIPFKPFIQKNGGGYEWRNVISPNVIVQCNSKACYLPVEIIEDPIPNLAPVLDSISLSTESLPASGGTIKAMMIAIDDVEVKKVETTYSVGTMAYNPQILSRTGTLGNTPKGYQISKWETTYTIPQNTGIAPRTIRLNYKMYDGEGGVTDVSGANAKTVQQAGVADTTPPQILVVTVTPQNFQASGGAVTVSVRASDNFGIGLVMLTLIMPDGRLSPMQMPLASGSNLNGEWRLTWNMWANKGSSPLNYGIKADVTDTSRNSVSSQTIPITVAGAPANAIQPQTSPAPGVTTPTQDINVIKKPPINPIR